MNDYRVCALCEYYLRYNIKFCVKMSGFCYVNQSPDPLPDFDVKLILNRRCLEIRI